MKENTGYDPGWIENGGIFIARNQVLYFHLILIWSKLILIGVEN